MGKGKYKGKRERAKQREQENITQTIRDKDEQPATNKAKRSEVGESKGDAQKEPIYGIPQKT
jgi:hypothetical protein